MAGPRGWDAINAERARFKAARAARLGITPEQTKSGLWAHTQQAMDEAAARRYHGYATYMLPGYMHEDLPKPGQICVIVGTEVSKKCGPSVHYLCPCGCGKEIFLPCHTPEEPRNSEPKWGLWLAPASNLVTLTPSIQDNGPCQSHYHIKHGRVEWC